ncbi:cysteine hydrolase [Paenibacillus aestuarii]|uniref:Cysteine hydrolase n=1 Tax=Paenibacillus aestuarii TaxID=516965 RepID=A0ABW0K4M9_9BACL|nr:cysteine hydrolase [Paenibacillus aestuarii]
MIEYCPICRGWYYVDMSAGREQTIIDEWQAVSVPPAPALQAVAVNPQTTALLVLDMETTICNQHRCIASIPKISHLVGEARAKGMPVVYSLTRAGHPSDIAPALTPAPGEPIVKSNVDKFYQTRLEEILRQRGITTVIVTGYAANGAVLHTATSAAFRGFDVIVPVDGMSAGDPYAEQYTAWHMLNSPGTRNRATLTQINMIHIVSR